MGVLHYLAHHVGLRDKIEKLIFKPVRSWKKLTAAASFDQELHAAAHRDAAAFAYQHFSAAAYFQSKKELYHFVLEKLGPQPGLCFECGVYKADTLNYFASKLSDRQWHGFDSFEGLPESWSGGEKGKGAFSLQGRLPRVRKNVQLHKGWFDQTVQPWLQSENQPVAFAHLDADLYSSTITVLDAMTPYAQTGTYILFDEYFGQIGWRQGEHQAWQEWLQKTGWQTECLAYSSSGATLFVLKNK